MKSDADKLEDYHMIELFDDISEGIVIVWVHVDMDYEVCDSLHKDCEYCGLLNSDWEAKWQDKLECHFSDQNEFNLSKFKR